MAHGVLPCSLPLSFTLPQGTGLLRLDAALGLALPGMGLRARRRLWGYCRISVNGRVREPGYAVSGGDGICVETAAPHGSSPPGLPHAPRPASLHNCFRNTPPPAPTPLEPVVSGPDYLAFTKPCGLHSAHVAGSPEPSLEALLNGSAILLTRLDKGTSGLVLAARSQEAAARFRALEAEGAVEKRYLAVLRGRLERQVTATGRLLTANTSVTRVLGDAVPDPARHSVARPLHSPVPLFGPDWLVVTLAEVIIHRGARHQIRAHLAHAGYPLLGEALYAAPVPDRISVPGVDLGAALEPGCLYLHHAEVTFPGFHASCPPPWTFPFPDEPSENAR